MKIRRAEKCDISRINDLLFQVARIHSDERPDIFKDTGKKYSDAELCAIIENDSTPIYVAENDEGYVCGYAFCIYEEIKDDLLLCDMKTLYIDDLCVDENVRGMHIGSLLYDHVKKEAQENGAYRITLNVWSFNESAMNFYKNRGLSPLKTVMEQLI